MSLPDPRWLVALDGLHFEPPNNCSHRACHVYSHMRHVLWDASTTKLYRLGPVHDGRGVTRMDR
jgi:hypothetical protein